MADGTIVFDTSLDTKEIRVSAEKIKGIFRKMAKETKQAFGIRDNGKQFKAMEQQADAASQKAEQLMQKVDQLRQKLADLQRQREENARSQYPEFQPSAELEGVINQAAAKRAELNAAKQRLAALKSDSKAYYLNGGEQEAKVRQLTKEYKALTDQADKLSAKEEAIYEKQKASADAMKAKKDAQLAGQIESTQNQIQSASGQLEQATAKASALRDRISEAMDSRRPTLFGKALGGVSRNFKQVTHRVSGLVKRVFLFSVITRSLRQILNLMKALSGSDKQVSTSLARIKGNLWTAFAPIWEAVLPALRKVLAVLEAVTAKMAQFTSAIFGKTASQSSKSAKALYEQANATKEAGDAAEEASKQLAGFDEINQLGSDDKSGGSDSGSSGIDWGGSDDLGELDAKTAKIMSYGSLILGTCLLVAGIALVNIPMILAGIALVKAGFAIGESTGAFENTPTWVKQIITWGTMILGTILLVVGIIQLNIPMILAGLALIGISASYGVKSGAFSEAWEAIKKFGKNVADFAREKWAELKNWFATNVKPIFTKEWWLNFFENTKQAIKEKWTQIKTDASLVWQSIKAFFGETWDSIRNKASEMWQGLKSDISLVWNQLKTDATNIFNNVKNAIINAFTDVRNRVTTIWNNIWSSIKGVINNILGGVERFINGIINGINFLIDRLNRLCATMPDWVKEHTPIGNFQVQRLQTVTLPRLASGTVVPANYGEFAAILGDNKRETEVVSPISTIKQALKEAMQESGGGNINAINLYISNRAISEAVIEYVNGKSKALGVSVIR